jgi:uncharacterized membrane protein YbhN (UPF0104 family)
LKQLKVVLPVVGFLIVCAFILGSIDVSALKISILSADPAWLGLAFGITTLQPFLTSIRLHTYLQAGDQPKPYTRCLKAVLAALSLNAVLPAKGGDLVKVTFLQDNPQELAPLAGIALMERVFDILVLCLLALIGSVYNGNNTTTWLSAIAMCAPVGALLLLSRAERVPVVGKKLLRLAVACRTAWKRPLLVARGCLIATLCWSTNLAVMFCLLKSVGAAVRVAEVAAATPLAIFVGLLPISISGMGTRDAALAHLLSGTTKEVVYAGTFLYTAAVYWFLALIGLAFLGKETLRVIMINTQQNQGVLKKAAPVTNT